MTKTILIVDDEADIRTLVEGILRDEGYQTLCASNSKEALELFETSTPDLVVLDIWLQGSDLDGMEILGKLIERRPNLPVIMISGHGTIETAVTAIKKGAYDFIEKPFKSDRLLLMVHRALEAAQLRRENETLKQHAIVNEDLIGQSKAMQTLEQILNRVAPTNSRVLLTGEPGTGKDIVARYIHNHSARAHEPFLVISCATLRPERLEIELFGSEGSTGEDSAQEGVLEKANGGTLLLDEVADMPLETQGKIVRVLQNQTFRRVGGKSDINVDVRFLASTHRDLETCIDKGTFRQDLYYRLNVVPIHLSPLRERTQDIPELASYFLKKLSKSEDMGEAAFSQAALTTMQCYKWPGNIRQLRNVIEWILIMNANKGERHYDTKHLPPELRGDTSQDDSSRTLSDSAGEGKSVFTQDIISLPLRDARERFERDYLLSQINRFSGNISKTAQFVGMERSALHRKLKSLDITSGEKDASELNEKARKTA